MIFLLLKRKRHYSFFYKSPNESLCSMGRYPIIKKGGHRAHFSNTLNNCLICMKFVAAVLPWQPIIGESMLHNLQKGKCNICDPQYFLKIMQTCEIQGH